MEHFVDTVMCVFSALWSSTQRVRPSVVVYWSADHDGGPMSWTDNATNCCCWGMDSIN